VNSPTFRGRLPISAAVFSKIFLEIRGIFTNLKNLPILMSELPSLFIANSKISLFLKKNLPLDHQKKFTCMTKLPKKIKKATEAKDGLKVILATTEKLFQW
jgi:hypothetical protein